MIRRVASLLAIGVAGGPLLALVFAWLAGTNLAAVGARPLNWAERMAFIGVCFALSFSLLCGPPVRFVARRLHAATPWKRRALVVLTGFCGGSLALLVVARVLTWVWNYVSWKPLPFGSWMIVDGVLAGGIALAVSYQERLILERDAADARAASAALTAQIRPHFLFNTLNAISAQVRLDPAAAQENLGRLADMFRYMLNQGGQQSVPIAEEIALAREYLLLEQTRYGARLEFELPEPIDVRLPPLTLQPLVENAVRHGICRRAEGGRVSVSLGQRGSIWYLKVRNPTASGESVYEPSLFRPGHALWILRQRHPALVCTATPGFFEVELRLS